MVSVLLTTMELDTVMKLPVLKFVLLPCASVKTHQTTGEGFAYEKHANVAGLVLMTTWLAGDTSTRGAPSTLTSTKPKEDPAGFDASRKYLPSSVRLFDGTLTTSLVMVRLMMESAKIENEKNDCCVLLVTLVIFSPPLGVVANNELE